MASGASSVATSGAGPGDYFNPDCLFPVKFVWDYHTESRVHLWMETVEGRHTTPMNRIGQGQYKGAHEVTVKLKPGRCEFRYFFP